MVLEIVDIQRVMNLVREKRGQGLKTQEKYWTLDSVESSEWKKASWQFPRKIVFTKILSFRQWVFHDVTIKALHSDLVWSTAWPIALPGISSSSNKLSSNVFTNFLVSINKQDGC